MADNSQIESAPTPSIRSLKSKFEQLAQPSLAGNVASYSPTFLTPDLPAHRSRASVGGDERPAHSAPRLLRQSTSSSDIKVTAKRAPPPPPSRGKRSTPSPAVSPLLRPVPVPSSLRSPHASPEHRPRSNERPCDDGDDDMPVLGNVASLRSRLSSAAAVSAVPPPRPTTPKLLPRLGGLTSRSDPSVHEHTLLSIPARHTKSEHSQFVSAITIDSPDDLSEHVSAADDPSRTANVASLRDRFATMNLPAPPTLKPHREDNLICHSEPNISAPGHLPILPARRPPPPPPSHSPPTPAPALFQTEENLDMPSSSNSSSHSPFSDEESDLSDITHTITAPPAIPPRKMRSSPGAINHGNHERKLSNSSSSSEGVTSPPKPKPPPRPSMQIPPRPPPRPPNGIPHDLPTVILSSSPPIPPPLPSRRVSPDGSIPDLHPLAPPLPSRNGVNVVVTEASSPVSERKPLGSSRLPPPPTRQIGLGDKLPPVRRPTTPSSDEDSIEEEDPRIRSTDALPDSSRSSRRPPSLSCFDFSEFKIQVPAHTGQVAVAGPSVVVATNHQIKHFDLSCNDGPVWTMDTREMNLRDAKVSCLEFRAASKEADHGQYVWAGTKEGHLFEIDIRMGCLTSSKLGVHTCQVTHIFRYRQMMLTVDDAGKVMAFNPDVGASSGSGLGDVSLIFTQPRVNRIGEKQDFVKMFGGLLWTSSRTDVSGTGTSSVPVIRIYDPGVSGCIARCVVPTQHVGAVTSGTLLSSHPNHVYIGHEGGSITVWDIATPDGTPVCVEVMKVSASDVLCLEGVNDRLWVGGRKGMISAYDVSHRPWVVTNCWEAHGGLPVLKLFVDPYAIEKAGRLCVVSIGRNEQLRLWDGLLGNDWICQELLKREHSFSMFRTINVLIVSWNIDAAKPDALTNDVENTNFFQNVFQNTDSPDIIAFGFQEVIDLENRKMAAKTVLLGGKKKGEEGKISEKVTSSYKRWHDRLILAVKMAMPPDSPYTVVHTESLVGLFTCMFVRNAQRASVTDAAIATIKRGMGGRYGNKGAIVARLVVDDSSLCFINCHLAAGQNHVRQRNADVTAMLEEKSVFPVSDDVDEEPLAYVGGGDGSMVLDHEIVFLNGDMNYRIDQRRESVIAAIHSGDLESLLVHDQLLKEMKYNRGFRLRAFQEGPLTFPPTYKYDRRSHEFDTSEKRRTPAWCDRILWRSCDPERVVQHHYRRYEATISDHRPISAAFVVTVKSVRHDARMREKEDVEALWVELQVALLERARVFYVEQAMI